MSAISRRSVVVLAISAVAIGVAVFLGMAGWPQPLRTLEFSGLVLAALLTSALAMQHVTAKDSAAMPPSFVVDLTTLLLLGPQAMMFVAAAGAIMQAVTDREYLHRIRRAIINTVTVIAAAQAAGLAHQELGGTVGTFSWPGQELPIALAVLAYCVVKSLSAGIIVPLLTKADVNRSWQTSVLRGLPGYYLGATVAVGLAMMIGQQMWELLPVAVIPLYSAYRAYRSFVVRLDEEHRRREVIAALDQGMAVVGSNGLVTTWSDALEHILDCPRARALGRSLDKTIPGVGKTELPRMIAEVLATGTPQTLAQLPLPTVGGGRTLRVRILPVAGGATLLWDDITERTREEHALKRSEERLALAADGANDGLWEWDLRSQEFYCSSRWRAMLGLSESGSVRAADWIARVHEEDRVNLKAALDAHLSGKTELFEHSHRMRHEDGAYRSFLCRGVAVRGTGGRPLRIAGSLTDTDRTAPQRSHSAGFLDPLTGLGNRAVFVERLGRRLEEFKQRRSSSQFATLYLDLDRFKIVNDSLGHLVGDELLTEVSRRLESCLRQGDALARLGGDEFAILLNEISDANQANAIAFRIQEVLSAPFSIGGREVFSSASVGIAFGHAQYNNPDEMMRDADTAMYHAKSRGKARHELFDADMHARELDRLELENDLRHAVNTNDFEVHFQPIVLLGSGMCVGFESLARWTRNGKPVSPATFIPLAEELGIIEPLGRWALQQACSTFADWKRRFPAAGLDYITVNVSSRQLMQQNFLWIVEQAVQKSGLKPCDLRLEITETALMDRPNEAAKLLRDLREFGAKIYLDDFGCGYSSLSHLANLPVDALKIDRSFVKNLLLPDRPAIVESILALARTLNTGVVAEGIEHEAQVLELERLGCTHAQGYLYSRPVSMKCAEEIIAANLPLGPKKVQQTNEVAPGAEFDFLSPQFKWPEGKESIVAVGSSSSRRLDVTA
jgi:diguanylate cyclase (GGDEF)-like protein/PAS domain S-box-containing protein